MPAGAARPKLRTEMGALHLVIMIETAESFVANRSGNIDLDPHLRHRILLGERRTRRQPCYAAYRWYSIT